jgi:hypothetical protein
MKKRRDPDRRPAIKALWNALDEVTFGADRILNLRESLPTAAEARARTTAWLRVQQAKRDGDVLVITGRGNQSAGGMGIIRQEILGMLPSLRRKGIIQSWREHTPGSIVITVAPLSSLFDAARRRRDERTPIAGAPSIKGLAPETLSLLRQLALVNLDALGVAASDAFIEQEMARSFSVLLLSASDAPDREAAVRSAIRRAIEDAGAS